MNKHLLTLLLTTSWSGLLAQTPCSVPSNAVYPFTVNGISYEIIKVNMKWQDAAACAVQRGGKLAEIMSKQENDSLFHYALNKAGINLSATTSFNGGGASYLWIGGNDIQNEGVWIWDGDGNLTGPQFWQGNFQNGNVVGGYFNAWGSLFGGEPDDAGNQDGLALALTAWPFGNAGEWNDLSVNDTLYFIVQYSDSTVSLPTYTQKFHLSYERDGLWLSNLSGINQILIISMDGRISEIHKKPVKQELVRIDLSHLPGGVYCVVLKDEAKEIYSTKFVKF
jgi:hypothetical protein